MQFSVIVPTYNRLELLKRTLESISLQQFNDFETIVVNDGSSDGTHEYLTALASEKKIKYLFHENKGPSVSRDEGIRNSSGTYVAFTDDDCVVPPDWLRSFKAHFDSSPVAGIGGSVRTGDPSNWFAAANDVMQNYLKEAVNAASSAAPGATPGMARSNPGSASSAPFFTSNNLAFRRDALLAVGGYDRRFGMGAEDRDLVHRVHAKGFDLLYDRRIVVEHFNDSYLSQFVCHQFQFGQGSYLFYHGPGVDRPSRMPLRTYLGMFFAPFGAFSVVKALGISCFIVVAQAAVTIGYLSAALTSTPRTQNAA